MDKIKNYRLNDLKYSIGLKASDNAKVSDASTAISGEWKDVRCDA